MRYLTVNEVMQTYSRVMQQTPGGVGILDLGALESAVAQPRMTFSGEDLYPTVVEKASALGYSLIQNHPFIDGNKRTGHAALEMFLVLNDHELSATVDEQVDVILQVAASKMGREAFTAWLGAHLKPLAQAPGNT